MGSSSVGVGVMGVGVSAGTTWNDAECVRRLDARQMHMMGDAAVAREIMCDSELVRAAAIRAGKPCRGDGGPNPALSMAPATPYKPIAVQVPPKPAVNIVGMAARERLRLAEIKSAEAAAHLANVREISEYRRQVWRAEDEKARSLQ